VKEEVNKNDIKINNDLDVQRYNRQNLKVWCSGDDIPQLQR